MDADAGTALPGPAGLAPERSTVPGLSPASFRGWWPWAVGALGAVLLLPLFTVSVPPLLDYPNHLARMVVLADGGRTPALARMYAPHWSVLPNLATDLAGVALLRAGLPPFLAGRLLLCLVLVLPPLGALAYHRALFGARRLWALAVGLVACNGLFLLGFMNFTASLGVALFVAAGWARWREARPARTVLATAFGAMATFFCHLGGVVFLAVLLAAQEAERLLPAWHARRWRALAREAATRAAALATAMAGTVALYGRAGMSGTTAPTLWRPPMDKLPVLFVPVLNYVPVLDFGTAGLVLGAIWFCRRRGWLLVPPRTVLGLSLLILFYAAMPDGMKGGYWADARFPVMAGLLLFAGTALRGVPRRPALALALGFALLFGTRQAVLVAAWHGRDRDVAQLRRAIAPVQAGDRVLVLRATRSSNRGFWHGRAPRSRDVDHLMSTEFHLAALLPIERHAFWPLLFAIPSQQPLAVRAPYRAISRPGGTPPDFHVLLRPPTPQQLREAPYLAGWRRSFDWVLVLDAEALPAPAAFRPDALRLVDDTGFAALYAVQPAP